MAPSELRPGRYLDPRRLLDVCPPWVSLRDVAGFLGVNPSVMVRPISVWQADRFAVKLGHHPLDIWPPEDFYGPELFGPHVVAAAAAPAA